ncbi:MAG: exonuclease/endonuclease/phosphatase family protein [Pirellulaceae bacterium]
MRLVSWNICHGGGKRVPQIIEQLRVWNADTVGLAEFRGTVPSQAIASELVDMGLTHQHSTVDVNSPNIDRLLLASRRPLAVHEPNGMPDRGRWIHATLDGDFPLSFVLLWVPNRDKTGIKYQFHNATVASLRTLAGNAVLAFGDTNTGAPGMDDEAPFFNAKEGQWYTNLANAGWVDLWRHRNPDRREYTWHNHSSGAG